MDLGAIPNASTTKFGGDQLSTFAKGNVFTRLRNCRSASHDNFANDNFEFAPATKVALA